MSCQFLAETEDCISTVCRAALQGKSVWVAGMCECALRLLFLGMRVSEQFECELSILSVEAEDCISTVCRVALQGNHVWVAGMRECALR